MNNLSNIIKMIWEYIKSKEIYALLQNYFEKIFNMFPQVFQISLHLKCLTWKKSVVINKRSDKINFRNSFLKELNKFYRIPQNKLIKTISKLKLYFSFFKRSRNTFLYLIRTKITQFKLRKWISWLIHVNVEEIFLVFFVFHTNIS